MLRRLSTAGAAVLIVIIGSSNVCAQAAPKGQAQRPASAVSGAPSAPGETSKGTEKPGREAFERGRVFYDSGQFDQAAVAFEEAYRLSGRDALLYNIYLSYRDANEPAKAAEALRGFLAKVPDIENRGQLEARLAALDAGLARDRDQHAAQAATPTVTQPLTTQTAELAPSVANEPASRQQKRRFWAGLSLAAVGGAMVLGSIATGVLARGKQQDLEDRCVGNVCDPSLRGTADSGKTLAHTTDALLFGGLALAGGGAALLFLFGGWERDHTSTPHVTASCTRDGCFSQTTVRF